MYFKWMVDLVTMPIELGKMKYFILAREDLINQCTILDANVTPRKLVLEIIGHGHSYIYTCIFMHASIVGRLM